MAKIHSLRISNFRGIKEFSNIFHESKLICLIGRGDSGKSTILEAISFVLSPIWGITFHDSDFYNCNTNNPIEIEAVISELPLDLINENKFGLHVGWLDKTTFKIHDEVQDHHERVLTIKLIVDKDLEPNWYVISHQSPDGKKISASDRAKLNVSMVADYTDRHFSWNRGNPLYSLLKLENPEEENDNVIVEALRKAKTQIDGYTFPQFDSVVKKVKETSKILGIDISGVKTTIDFRDLLIKDGKVSLHEKDIPFRLKGKGSKRLISIAIQMALAQSGGIILIDEIEQGLEPDRVQNLINTFKKNPLGQIFITTHSRDALVELEAEDLLLMKEGASELIPFDTSLQGCIRKNPEAFFATKIIVEEGASEIGICRALNRYRVSKGKDNIAYKGVRFADGEGNKVIDYCIGFTKGQFPTALFCDSDTDKKNPILKAKKEELQKAGVKVIDWEEGDCLETAVSKNLPFKAVQEMLDLAVSLKQQESGEDIDKIKVAIWDSVKSKFGEGCPIIFEVQNDSEQLREAIGKAAHKKSWFKNQSKAEALGDVIFRYFDELSPDNILKKQLSQLSDWID